VLRCGLFAWIAGYIVSHFVMEIFGGYRLLLAARDNHLDWNVVWTYSHTSPASDRFIYIDA